MKQVKRNAMAVVMVAASGITAPALAADAAKGAQLYAMHCTSCHGRSGIPVMPGSPNFTRAEGLLQPDLAIMQAIRSGKNAMPGYAGILRDNEILDVIAYMRTLQR